MGGFFSKGKSSGDCVVTTKFDVKQLSDALRTSVGKAWSAGFVVKSFEYAQRPDSAVEGYIYYQVGQVVCATSWVSVAPNRVKFTSEGVGAIAGGNGLSFVETSKLQLWSGETAGVVATMV